LGLGIFASKKDQNLIFNFTFSDQITFPQTHKMSSIGADKDKKTDEEAKKSERLKRLAQLRLKQVGILLLLTLLIRT
jgi:hypothetical protein